MSNVGDYLQCYLMPNKFLQRRLDPVHLYHVCLPVDVMDSSRLKLLVVLWGVCGTQGNF